MSKYRVIPGPYFPVFGLNTEICEVNLRIQSEYRKIWTWNNSVFGHFSHSDRLTDSLSELTFSWFDFYDFYALNIHLFMFSWTVVNTVLSRFSD